MENIELISRVVGISVLAWYFLPLKEIYSNLKKGILIK